MPIAACDEVNANLCPFMSLKKTKKIDKIHKNRYTCFFYSSKQLTLAFMCAPDNYN